MCTYQDCTATAERDWLLQFVSDDVREAFFAIRDLERDRIHDLAHTTGNRHEHWVCVADCDRVHSFNVEHLVGCGYR